MTKDGKDTAIYIAYEDFQPLDTALPEKNLLRAILTTAMSDLKKSGEPKRKAVEFFLNTEDDYIFSFQSICNLLDLNPGRILTVTGMKPSDKPVEPKCSGNGQKCSKECSKDKISESRNGLSKAS